MYSRFWQSCGTRCQRHGNQTLRLPCHSIRRCALCICNAVNLENAFSPSSVSAKRSVNFWHQRLQQRLGQLRIDGQNPRAALHQRKPCQQSARLIPGAQQNTVASRTPCAANPSASASIRSQRARQLSTSSFRRRAGARCEPDASGATASP